MWVRVYTHLPGKLREQLVFVINFNVVFFFVQNNTFHIKYNMYEFAIHAARQIQPTYMPTIR